MNKTVRVHHVDYNSPEEFFVAFLPASVQDKALGENDFQKIGAKLAERALARLDQKEPDHQQEQER